MRRTWIMLSTSATHFVCGFAVFAASFGASMDRMDSGSPPSLVGSLVSLASNVLWFPASALASVAGEGWLSGVWGWPLLVANSLLWGAAVSYLAPRLAGAFRGGARAAPGADLPRG